MRGLVANTSQRPLLEENCWVRRVSRLLSARMRAASCAAAGAGDVVTGGSKWNVNLTLLAIGVPFRVAGLKRHLAAAAIAAASRAAPPELMIWIAPIAPSVRTSTASVTSAVTDAVPTNHEEG